MYGQRLNGSSTQKQKMQNYNSPNNNIQSENLQEECFCEHRHNHEECKEHEMNMLQGLPLGMAYVPVQTWREIYAPELAFERGTIFKELDLPFLGKRC